MGKKAVIVTGASGDIGQAIAKKFIENNYIVIGTFYKSKKEIIKIKSELGEDFYYLQCDLSDFDSAKNLFNFIYEHHFRIDVLINNAGISVVGILQDLTKESWKNIWNTNVTSVVSLSRCIIPHFLKNGHGKIINISSVWGNRGASMEVAYSATKGAINSFTKALAKELAPSNIQVNAISCGIINTKMNSHLSAADIKDIKDEIPSGRIGTVEDIANAVFTISDMGEYITGQIITVDGGWTV